MFYPLIQNDQGGGYFLERNGTHVLAAMAVSSKKTESGIFAQMNQSALCMYSTYSVQEISFLLLETLIQVALAPSPSLSATSMSGWVKSWRQDNSRRQGLLLLFTLFGLCSGLLSVLPVKSGIFFLLFVQCLTKRIFPEKKRRKSFFISLSNSRS